MNRCWRLFDAESPRTTIGFRYEISDPAIDDHVRYRGYEPAGEVICQERKIRLSRIYQFERRQPWLEELVKFDLVTD